MTNTINEIMEAMVNTVPLEVALDSGSNSTSFNIEELDWERVNKKSLAVAIDASRNNPDHITSIYKGPVVFSSMVGPQYSDRNIGGQAWNRLEMQSMVGPQYSDRNIGGQAWNRLEMQSMDSLIDTVNHNCIVIGAILHRKYGLILELRKVSTGARLNLDMPLWFVPVSGLETDVDTCSLEYDVEGLQISQGKGFPRYEAPATVLDGLAPATKALIAKIGEKLDKALIHWNGKTAFELDLRWFIEFSGASHSSLYRK